MENIFVEKVKSLLCEASFKDACRADFKTAVQYVVERSHEESEPVVDLFASTARYLDDLDSNAVVFLIDNVDGLDSLDGNLLYKVLCDAFGEPVGEYVADTGWDEKTADDAEPFTLADAARQLAEWREEDEYLRRVYEHDKGVYV